MGPSSRVIGNDSKKRRISAFLFLKKINSITAESMKARVNTTTELILTRAGLLLVKSRIRPEDGFLLPLCIGLKIH